MDDDLIPLDDHLVRHIRGRHVLENEAGISASEFMPRPNDQYLSFNWLEFYNGNYSDQLLSVIKEVGQCRTIKGRDRFGTFAVSSLIKRCQNEDVQIEIRHKPLNDPCPLPSHSGVFDLSNQPEFLAEILAEELQNLHFPNGQMVTNT